MRRHDLLRASDADRDAVVDRLREAAGEGRLEPDELEHRVEGALRARTYGDLAELLADLPGHGRAPARRAGSRTHPVARSAMIGAGLLVAVTAAVALVAVVAVLALVAAACWATCLLIWRLSRRRLASGTHRARPAGFL